MDQSRSIQEAARAYYRDYFEDFGKEGTHLTQMIVMSNRIIFR